MSMQFVKLKFKKNNTYLQLFSSLCNFSMENTGIFIFLKMKSNQNNQRTSMRCADLLYQPNLADERMHAYLSSSTAACAAAKRAIGTRNGEQEA